MNFNIQENVNDGFRMSGTFYFPKFNRSTI